MKFVTGEPALLTGGVLVVADLHIGIEYEFYRSGMKLPSQTPKMLKRAEKLLKSTRASMLVILGDVKHKVPGISRQETREIPEFLSRLVKRAEVRVVPGNHDGGLAEHLPGGVEMMPNEGFKLGKTYFSHGHTWPAKDFLRAERLVVGHNHPQVEFRDALGYRFLEPVWVRAELSPARIEKKYGKVEGLPELVVMPVFNHFAGGAAVNSKIEAKEFLGPIVKCMDRSSAKVYLLDGTLLGKLKDL